MNQLSLIDILLCLIIYSFLGWCCESIYCSLAKGEWINRGFLTGPFCPIYGFGALITLYFLQYLPNSALIVFIGGLLLTSTLEYVTSWLMEKCFNARWWDYSKRPFNLNGRVCLLNSTLFGLMCLFLYYDVHPNIVTFLRYFNNDFKMGFLAAFMLYFIVDLTLAIRSALGINIRLKTVNQLREQLIEKYGTIDNKLDLKQLEKYLAEHNIRDDLSDKFKQSIHQVNFFERRLMHSFPQLQHHQYPKQLEQLKEEAKHKNKQ